MPRRRRGGAVHDGVHRLALGAVGRVRVGVHAPAQRDHGRARERHEQVQRAQGEAQLARRARGAAEQRADQRGGKLVHRVARAALHVGEADLPSRGERLFGLLGL